MRCRNERCRYNEDCCCSQPDYVCIDENGECEQMVVPAALNEQTDAKAKEEAKAAYKVVVHEKVSDYIQEITGGNWGFGLNEDEKAAMLPKVIETMEGILADYIQTSDLCRDALNAAFDCLGIER